MNKFNQLEWGGRLMPTPFSKTIELPHVANSFCFVSTSEAVQTTLHLSNLTASKRSYCFELVDETPQLDIVSSIPYVVYSNQEPFMDFDLYRSFDVAGLSCRALKFQAPIKLVIKAPLFKPFRLIDSDSEIIFDGELDGVLEINYQGSWLAFEASTLDAVNFEVRLNDDANQS